MLEMVDVEFIRKKHLVGKWSIRKISREVEVSRQSVRKVIRCPDPPHYELRNPRPSPVMGSFREIIRQWLDEDQRAPRKQRHTARRVYDRLCEEYQFKGAESTVRRCVAQLKGKRQEVFIPLEAGWGEQAQVDWGQAQVRIDGKMAVAHLFCLRLRASAVPFAWAAPTEKLEAFLEGHVKAFAWLGGVPRECVYDNPKTAVVRILSGPHRQEHEIFSSLRAYYLFDSTFCRPAEGHEKGSVENLVGYVRRNALVPVPDLPSWEALNQHLLKWCEGERERLRDRWQSERVALLPLPAKAFRAGLTQFAYVNRLSLITVDRNRYSVPCRYVGGTLQLTLFSDRIELWDKKERVAVHERCYGRGETKLLVEHYLPALARKPRAAKNAAVVRQMPKIYGLAREKLCYGNPEGYREFAQILLLHQLFPGHAVTAALEESYELGCFDATVVRQLVLNRVAISHVEPIPVPPRLADLKVAVPSLAEYDQLLAGVSG